MLHLLPCKLGTKINISLCFLILLIMWNSAIYWHPFMFRKTKNWLQEYLDSIIERQIEVCYIVYLVLLSICLGYYMSHMINVSYSISIIGVSMSEKFSSCGTILLNTVPSLI